MTLLSCQNIGTRHHPDGPPTPRWLAWISSILESERPHFETVIDLEAGTVTVLLPVSDLVVAPVGGISPALLDLRRVFERTGEDGEMVELVLASDALAIREQYLAIELVRGWVVP